MKRLAWAFLGIGLVACGGADGTEEGVANSENGDDTQLDDDASDDDSDDASDDDESDDDDGGGDTSDDDASDDDADAIADEDDAGDADAIADEDDAGDDDAIADEDDVSDDDGGDDVSDDDIADDDIADDDATADEDDTLLVIDGGSVIEIEPITDCDTDLPNYPCELARNAFGREAESVLYEQCADCHSETRGQTEPLLFGGYVESFDVLLPYLRPRDLAASPLVDFVREGHQCAVDCDAEANADALEEGLAASQARIDQALGWLAELDAAQARWVEAGVTDYQWRIENGCFACIGFVGYSARAVVSGGELSSLWLGEVFSAETQPSNIEDAFGWHTVLGMFEQLRQEINSAPDFVDARYDAELGYVRKADIDFYSEYFDDENYYYSSEFLLLGAGYCEAGAPLRADVETLALQVCTSTTDCEGCVAHSQIGPACDDVYTRCESDGGCGAGYNCVPYQVEGCGDVGTYCRRDCSEEACPSGYACDPESDLCVEQSCSTVPGLCVDEEHCQPESARAGRHGCVPLSCAESEIDCGEFATCDPESPAAHPNGCAGLACTSDADCGCGSCMNQRCETSPGVCFNAPAGPFGPPLEGP